MPRSPAQFEAMRQASQEKILKSAVKLFAQYGFQATTISMIARDSDLSGGLVYAYYEDKEKLLDCVLAQTFTKLDVLFADETIRASVTWPFAERVTLAFDTIMLRVDCFQLLVQLMMQEGTPPAAIEQIRKLSLYCKNKLSEIFPEQAARHLPGMIHAAITSYLVFHNSELFEQQREAIRQLSSTLQERQN